MQGAKFVINGGMELEGEIEVGGSKNAALAAMPASLLFSAQSGPFSGWSGQGMFPNLPKVEDIKRMRELLFVLQSSGEINLEIAKKFRASILAVGPALARFGKVVFPHPGGCVIGARPIDVFLDGWKKMGVRAVAPLSKTEHGTDIYGLSAPNGLTGCDYTLRVPSVTGTEGLIMTAVLAKGDTVLRNAAIEPEIVSLADFLNQNGAKISGAGSDTISIEGRDGKLFSSQKPFIVPKDRIEAGSFIILGALAAKELIVKGFNAEETRALFDILKQVGAGLEIGNDFALVKKTGGLRGVRVKTGPYPGFVTDLQAPFTVLLTQAAGESFVHEAIFDGRLNYTEDLNKMGARIVLEDSCRARISGSTALRGRHLDSPDLRAGLAFVIAALIANGRSEIGNIYQIDRGYERIEKRLTKIGADIKRIN